MPSHRKVLGAAALTLAVSGGAVAGALIGAPGTSGADEGGDNGDSGESSDHREVFEGGIGFGPLGGDTLATAAEAIGIEEDELRNALEDGQTIAEVAEENDVDVQTVIDALVSDAADELEEAIDELPAEMEDLVNEEGFPGIMGGHLPGEPGEHFSLAIPGCDLGAAAEAIGIEEDELRNALEDGQTIAEVAEENDVDVQTVVDAMTAESFSEIDQAVEDGDLDANEAEEIKQDVTERTTDFVNGEMPEPPALPHGPGELGERWDEGGSPESGESPDAEDSSIVFS